MIFSKRVANSNINWTTIKDQSGYQELIKESDEDIVMLFKFSSRCFINHSIKNHLEDGWESDLNIKAYFLDIIKHRQLSGFIAINLNVTHESPQLILVSHGKAIYHASHSNIDYQVVALEIFDGKAY